MKVALHSDLHLEMNRLSPDFLKDKDFDVLILAGDITTHMHYEKLSQIRDRCPSDKLILYVPGNHEYYQGSIEATDKRLSEFCEDIGIIYANNTIVRLNGKYSFVCSTAWATLDSFQEFCEEEKKSHVEYGIADFRMIDGNTVEAMVDRGKRDANFINTSLKVLKEEHPDDTVVVVTHFSPTENHGNDKFPISPIASYFSNKLEGIMYEHTPDYWFYGHTHSHAEHDVYHTKVCCNQHGYGRECTFTYNPNRIIEI